MEVLDRYESLIDDWEAFESAIQRPLRSVARVNTLKTTIDRAKTALDEGDIAYESIDWHDGLLRFSEETPGGNWPYVHGWLHGQEEVSALPPVVLDSQPGERIWDATAAPGSKTTQIGALMEDTGLLVATDDNLGRLSALRSNAERLGLTNLAITNEDARHHSLKPFGDEQYDRVLVDVPCSCEGTVRKHPTTLDTWTLDHVHGIADVQKTILKRAIEVTQPGGTVVYSTCTFAPEENEAVLDFALGETSCSLQSVDLPLDSRPGVTEWDGTTFDSSVEKAHRIYPHLNDTGGFFIAKLEVTG